MDEYIPWLLILMAVIAFVAYIIHGRWFDRHPWPGSSREELDRILKRNQKELVLHEGREQWKERIAHSRWEAEACGRSKESGDEGHPDLKKIDRSSLTHATVSDIN